MNREPNTANVLAERTARALLISRTQTRINTATVVTR